MLLPTLLLFLLCVLCGENSSAIDAAHSTSSGQAPPQSTGPTTGTLVIAGGGGKAMDITFGRFLELAGGKDAPIVIIPTASSTSPNFDYLNHPLLATARDVFGATNVTILHTHDRAEADTRTFIAPLHKARGIWFTGGRQWHLADAYLGTRTERAFRKVLDRGGVIGGGSAGATIQGSFLIRGDTSGPDVLIGDHQTGFGYITNSAIDQHLIPRNRQNDLITTLTDADAKMEKSIDREALLGIGIDEDTAIVVRGNQFEVIGKATGVVHIYDPRQWTEGMSLDDKFLILHIGDRYDLAKRAQLPLPDK